MLTVTVGSLAAGVQSVMGAISAGSTFAVLQSAAVSDVHVVLLQVTNRSRWADIVQQLLLVRLSPQLFVQDGDNQLYRVLWLD
jgi:hypothetical protein